MKRENGFLEIIGIVANEDTHYSLSLRGPTGLQLEIRMMSSTRALISRGLVRAELLVPPVLRLQAEQRMMVSTPPTSPTAPERLQELRGTTSSTPVSSSKRLHRGGSMTYQQ